LAGSCVVEDEELLLGDELLAPPLGVLELGELGLVELELLLELGELELAPPEAEPDLVSLDADPLMLPEGELEEDGLDGLEGLEELDDEAPPDGDVGELLGEDDHVAVRVRGEATHSAMIMGIPPTGRRIAWTENELFRFEHGQIVESWGEGTLDTALATIGLSFKSKPRSANVGGDEDATIAQEVPE